MSDQEPIFRIIPFFEKLRGKNERLPESVTNVPQPEPIFKWKSTTEKVEPTPEPSKVEPPTEPTPEPPVPSKEYPSGSPQARTRGIARNRELRAV